MNPIVSLFRHALSQEQSHVPLQNILGDIKNGKYRAYVEKLRGFLQSNPEQYDVQKKYLPAFTVSGRAESRKKALEHSGLLQGDLDKLNSTLPDVRQLLKNDPHVAFVFLSPSGNGLKFGIAINPSDHTRGFLAAQSYFRSTYKLEIDPSVKDRLRLCFVSFDPDLWINPAPLPVPDLPPEPPKPKPAFSTNVIVSSRQEIAQKVLGEIRWQNDLYGFCRCPGEHLHTTSTGPEHCDVRLEGVPTIHCFHGHCASIVSGVNHQLRSEIAKAEYVPRGESQAEPAPRQSGPSSEYIPSGDEFDSLPAGPPDWNNLLEDTSATLTAVIPEPIESIHGLVSERSKILIGGGSKTFKTWLSIHLALCVQRGIGFIGRKTVVQRVLYVNLELKSDTFKRRVQKVAEHLNIEVFPDQMKELHLRGKLSGLKVSDIVDRIVRAALSFQATLVVLDPIYKLNLEGDENSSRDQTILFNHLDRITTEARATLVFNDHFSKGNQAEKDPLDAIRGSSAKGGDVDAAIILRALEEPLCYRVDVVHRELPPVEPFAIGWTFPVFELRPDLDPESLRRPKRAKGGPKPRDLSEILSPMFDHPQSNPCSFRQWADALKISHSTLQPYVSILRSKGFIATSGEGNSARQFITDAGIQFLNQQQP